MSPFVFASEAPFDGTAAVVVKRTSNGNTHAGILHSRNEVLHLGWEDQLSTTWRGTQLWATPTAEPENLSVVAAYCRLLVRRFDETKRFPYGFRFEGTSISQQGDVVPGPGAYGLTCATFVLAIFDRAGIRLIELSTWPIDRAEDQAFIRSLCAHALPEHAALLEAEAAGGTRRVRPEEVLGACACALPAPFHEVAIASLEVVLRLDDSR
jgi:hypothetical protein